MQSLKKSQKKPKAHQVLYHAGSPLERIHINRLEPLIETPRGNRYVLVVVDQLSKWVECYSLLDQTTERVARTLVSEFMGRFGCPLELHSDQGRHFESRMFKEVCDLLKIVKTGTTSWSGGTYEPHHLADTPMLYPRTTGRFGYIHGYCRYGN